MPELVQTIAALVAVAGATAWMTYRVLRRRRCNGCNRCERALGGSEGERPSCPGKGVRAPGLRVYPGGP
ncbi:MAG: hypothetical protein R3B09_22065 [Nannocystaceae bacterium]